MTDRNMRSQTDSKMPSDDQSAQVVASRIHASFFAEFHRSEIEASRQLSLLLQLAIILLVPGTYLALIGLVAYSTFHYALLGTSSVFSNTGTLLSFTYWLPILSAGLLILLLLRPFFPIAKTTRHTTTLNPRDAAELTELVAELSKHLGFP